MEDEMSGAYVTHGKDGKWIHNFNRYILSKRNIWEVYASMEEYY
jgi:hypothetical protein